MPISFFLVESYELLLECFWNMSSVASKADHMSVIKKMFLAF